MFEDDIRKGYGDKLLSDTTILAQCADTDEIWLQLQDRLSDWEIQVAGTKTSLLLQKNLPNIVDDGSTPFSIEITTTGVTRLWRRTTFKNLFGDEIEYFGMLGTTAKDVSRMLQQFRPPVPNTEFELKEGMQGILALTVVTEKPEGFDHFEQMQTINDWCLPNNFCVTAQMAHDFWSEVRHDCKAFVDSVIAMIDREQTCTGVVISSAATLEEIVPEACTELIAQLRERGKHLYATDAGEIKMAPHKEFAMIREGIEQEEAQQEEPEPDLESVLEKIRVGVDQLDYISAGNHKFSINVNGTDLEVIEIRKNNGFYNLSIMFYGPEGRPWSQGRAVCAWEFVLSNSKQFFADYEKRWVERLKKRSPKQE
jgi:hypothetical protein